MRTPARRSSRAVAVGVAAHGRRGDEAAGRAVGVPLVGLDRAVDQIAGRGPEAVEPDGPRRSAGRRRRRGSRARAAPRRRRRSPSMRPAEATAKPAQSDPAPRSSIPREPSARRSTSRGRAAAEDHEGAAAGGVERRAVALWRADDHVGQPVAVDVAAAVDRIAGLRAPVPAGDPVPRAAEAAESHDPAAAARRGPRSPPRGGARPRCRPGSRRRDRRRRRRPRLPRTEGRPDRSPRPGSRAAPAGGRGSVPPCRRP